MLYSKHGMNLVYNDDKLGLCFMRTIPSNVLMMTQQKSLKVLMMNFVYMRRDRKKKFSTAAFVH